MDYDLNNIFSREFDEFGPLEVFETYRENPELLEPIIRRRPGAYSQPHLSRSNPRLSRSSTPAELAALHDRLFRDRRAEEALLDTSLAEFIAAEDAYEAAMSAKAVL